MSNKGKIGISLLCFIMLLALLGPFFSGYQYDEMNLEKINIPPGKMFWFGSDDLGRDIFTRVCYGARISLFVGITAAFIDMVIGVAWGGVAGYCGERVDQVMMRFADILYSLPYLLIVILLLVIMGPGIGTILIAISIIGWISMARIVRGQVLQLKEQEYVLAAISMGASPTRVLFRHIMPNAMGPILVTLTMTIPSAIFAESFLSFLGLGVQAPIASWGTMASEGLPALSYYPWRLFFPSFSICLTIFAFNLLAEGFDTK